MPKKGDTVFVLINNGNVKPVIETSIELVRKIPIYRQIKDMNIEYELLRE